MRAVYIKILGLFTCLMNSTAFINIKSYTSPHIRKSIIDIKTNIVPPMLTSDGTLHTVLNIAVPLIVPAHGSVDVFDALQRNKTKNYLSANLLAYISYPLINYVSPELALILFLSLSAYHFRHQFELFGDLSIIPASLFVYYGFNHPDILYIFLAFIHTPHQYWKFRDVILKDKELSTVVITVLTGLGLCISYNDWNNNAFITATLIAHIFYQEYIRFL
tara:strand:+ start:3683 stop:4339 length:657 start_codon:yes stop_codon:yes gene_type:complete